MSLFLLHPVSQKHANVYFPLFLFSSFPPLDGIQGVWKYFNKYFKKVA